MSDIVKANSDIKLSIEPLSSGVLKKIQTALETRAKILGRVKSYESNTTPYKLSRNSNFVASAYDLSEIARAADIEPYIMQSIKKHRTNILKEGYEIYGTNEETVNYITNRLYEISLMTQVPTLQWVRELITNILTYHNGFLVLRRDPERSSGVSIRMFGKKLNPIAGIFVGDPLTMSAEIDKFGTPLRWKQTITGSDGSNGEVFFDTSDVIHIAIDRKTGFLYGTPYLVSVLDDLRALRKLEELVLVIAEKEAFPLYHYKVGTENQPAMVFDDGNDEVSGVLGQLNSTPNNGYIVTTQRHEIKLLSRDKSAMDLKPLLDYFESRAMGGLSLSPLDLGRGGTANRGTGGLIGKNLEDSAKDYQSIISAHLTQFLIVPLLLEGGFDVTSENMVYFKFPLIDREELRANQNHGLQLFLGNAISLAEFRKDFLNKEGELDETDTAMHKQLEADLTLAKTAKAVSGTSAPTSGVSRTVANRSKPSNQFGSTNKSRFKKKNDYKEDVLNCLNDLKSRILANHQCDVNNLILDFCSKASVLSREIIIEAIESGFQSAEDQYFDNTQSEKEVEEIGARAIDRFFSNFINKSFWKILNPYKSSIAANLKPDVDGNTPSYMIIKIFEVIAKDITTLVDEQIETAKRFGFAKLAKRVGYNKIDIINDNQEIVEQINISEIIYKDLLPTTNTSNCFLRLPLENNESI